MEETILIADDEPIIRMDIREMLEDRGYRIAGEAKNGLEAIEMCRKYNPAVVIMDIKMPLMDGVKAAKVINQGNMAGAIIVLTAFSENVMMEQAESANITGYITKPVDEDTLIPVIEKALKSIKKGIK